MGQSGSTEGPSATIERVTRDFLQFRFDLEPFPDEILQKILSFLPPRELVTRCRLVSRRWKHLVDSPTLWKLKCEHERHADLLRASSLCNFFPWQRVFVKEIFWRNLIRNPCGQDGFDHWNVIHGGDGWVVENNRCPVEGAESQTCFVTSFFWCSKSQTIDLLKEGFCEHYLDVHQPPIVISDWVAGREDCGCMYEINIHLLAADRQSIKTFSNPTLQIDQWNNQIYHQVSSAMYKQYTIVTDRLAPRLGTSVNRCFLVFASTISTALEHHKPHEPPPLGWFSPSSTHKGPKTRIQLPVGRRLLVQRSQQEQLLEEQVIILRGVL
ncbi:F-box only 17-like [Pelobates cultripes]|uniref:F-box only 17-like n=1 Tax=Pelobates cultripes TaxID=61616 RepID=A0AAD1SY13_PELCU|nr:F-box only 17-like [Pelobates cultripes]